MARVKSSVDTFQRLIRIGPFAWASDRMTQEQAAEHLKRIRNDYCAGTVRDTLNRFVPQPAGPRRVIIRVAEPIAVHDYHGDADRGHGRIAAKAAGGTRCDQCRSGKIGRGEGLQESLRRRLTLSIAGCRSDNRAAIRSVDPQPMLPVPVGDGVARIEIEGQIAVPYVRLDPRRLVFQHDVDALRCLGQVGVNG